MKEPKMKISSADIICSIIFAGVSGIASFGKVQSVAFPIRILLICIEIVMFMFLILTIKYGIKNIDCHFEYSFFPKSFSKIFIILLFSWVPLHIITFASGIEYDSESAILSYLGQAEHSNNPLWSYIVFGGVYSLGVKIHNYRLAVFLYRSIQLLTVSAVISYIFSKKVKQRKISFVLLFSFVLLCVIPQFSLYASTMGKDSIFMLFTLIYCLTIYRIFNEEKFPTWNTVLLLLTSALIPTTRNGAFMLTLLTSLLVVVFADGKRKKYIALLSCAAAIVGGVVIPNTMRETTPKTEEMLSIPIQQIGYFAHNDLLTCEEASIIEELFSGTDVASLYNPNISDPLKQQFHYDLLSDEQKQDFWKIWRSCTIRHPSSALKAFLAMNNIYYTPTLSCSVKPHISSLFFTQRMDSMEVNAALRNGISFAKKYDKLFCSSILLGYFTRIGIYSWAMLYGIITLLQRRDKRVIAYIPIFLIFIGCCFSPVNGYFRYAFPFVTITVILNMCVYSDVICPTRTVCDEAHNGKSLKGLPDRFLK